MSIGLFIVKVYKKEPVINENGIYSAIVLEIPCEKEKSVQTVLKLSYVIKNDSVLRSEEKIMAWFHKSEPALSLKPGDNVLFSHIFSEIKNYNNPFEFDYKKYLAGRRIFRQVFLNDDKWILYSGKPHPVPAIYAENIRLKLLSVYRDCNLKEQHINILSALTLGYKRDLDPETKQMFSSAGVIHVLAVSGLHVGLVFMIFSICFGFLRKNRFGRIIFPIVSVAGLWFFALLTGLSPSVSRASLMFSLVVTGNNIKRKANICNTLAVSAFFLLIVNPFNLFDIGFLLSYSAVFGIVFLQPHMEKLIDFKYRLLKYFWVIFTVSVSAQIITFPLTVFFFNQVPVYFWVTNMVIIPIITLLIPLGFILLLSGLVPAVFSLILPGIDKIIDLLLSFLEFIEQLPFSVINISLAGPEVFFFYLILLSFFLLIKTGNCFYFKSFLVSVLIILCLNFAMNASGLNRREVIIYNCPGKIIVHLIKGDHNYIISNKEIIPGDFSHNIINRTVIKQRLETPVFLKTNQNFKDGHLCFINNWVSFEDKVILICEPHQCMPDNIIPDIMTGKITQCTFQDKSLANKILISSTRTSNEHFPEDMKVHYLEESGAYKEKW